MTNSKLGPNGFLYGGSADNQKTVLDHPVGLFVLFFTEMWERFSYYGMRALLVLFLVTEIAGGGWGWERSAALTLYGFYTGLVYLTPIFGGLIADKLLGYRKAVVLGALIMTLGHASMAVETEIFFYAGLVLLILGNGLFKPNISAIVGQLYPNSPEKKDGAYTIFYMGINAGAFLGILLCGYIGEKVGWSYGFGLAGIFMFLGMLQFYFAQQIFGDIGLEPNEETIEEKRDKKEVEELGSAKAAAISRDRIIVISVFAFFTVFFWMAFEQAGGSMTIFADDYTQRILSGSAAQIFFWSNTILTIAPLAIVTWVLWKLFSQIFAKYSVSNIWLGLSFAIIWGIALWMVNKEYNTKTYEVQLASQETADLRIDQQYADGDKILVWGESSNLKVVSENRQGSYSSEQEVTVMSQKKDTLEVPASWFGILNSFFIISFAPIFGRIWESRYNPSGPTKFGIGLILLGLGFAVLAYGGMGIEKGAQTASVSMWWLIIAYWFHTMGELCVSPVGLSYVSKLAPAKLVGLMFGIWFVANFIANTLAGLSGSLIDKISEAYSISGFFLIFTAIPIAAGLVMLALNKGLIKKMHGYR
ncbi:MAG: peptide MFS transporter [Bacteroidota bacterium]